MASSSQMIGMTACGGGLSVAGHEPMDTWSYMLFSVELQMGEGTQTDGRSVAEEANRVVNDQ